MGGKNVRTKHPIKAPQASAVAPSSTESRSLESRSLGRVPSKLRNKQARKAGGRAQVHNEAPSSPPRAQPQQDVAATGASNLPRPSVLTADLVWAKITTQINDKSTGPTKKSADTVWENIQEKEQAVKAAKATKPAAVAAAEAAAGGGQPELHPSYQSTIDHLIGSKGQQQQAAPAVSLAAAPPVPSDAAPKAAPSPTSTPQKRPLVNPEQAAAARAQRMAKRRKQIQQQQQQPTVGGPEERRPEAPAGPPASSAAAEAQRPLKDATQPKDAPSAAKERGGASAAADQAPGIAASGALSAAPSTSSSGGLEAAAATVAEKERDGGGAGALGGDKGNKTMATDAGTVPEAKQGPGKESEAPESAEDAPELLNPMLTKRMVKNRESAARSRAKKQALTDELRAQVEALKKENGQLKMELAVYKEKEAAESNT